MYLYLYKMNTHQNHFSIKLPFCFVILLCLSLIQCVQIKQKVFVSYPVDVKKDTSSNTQSFTITINEVSYRMILVEAGTFTMGSKDESFLHKEGPAHQVTLSDYYIGETEVTQALWKAVLGYNPSKYVGDNLPVDNVNWNDCQKFIKKINKISGIEFRLPTEAEWEFAARGGKKSKGYIYSGSDVASEVAWYDVDEKRPHLVGTKKPNELGIYDMSGNVYEWCQDWYGRYSGEIQINPRGPNFGEKRVIRSCSWFDFESFCEITSRGGISAEYGSEYRGFRLVSNIPVNLSSSR